MVLTFLVGHSLACSPFMGYGYVGVHEYVDKNPKPAKPVVVVVTTTQKPIWRRFPTKIWGSRGQYSKPSSWRHEPSRTYEQPKPFRTHGQRQSFYERNGFHPEEIRGFNPEEPNGFNPEEATSKMFNIVDKDGDGEISFQDFLDTNIVLFNKDRTNDKLRIIFDKCDNDKSGNIDKAELSQLLNSISSFGTQRPKSASTSFSRISTIPSRNYGLKPKPKWVGDEYYRRLSDTLTTDTYGPRKQPYWEGQLARTYVAPIKPIYVDGEQVYP